MQYGFDSAAIGALQAMPGFLKVCSATQIQPILCVMGSIFGSIVDNFTRVRLDKSSYQIPLGSLFIVPTILGISLFFVPESPRWLLHKGRDQQSRRSLEALRGDSLGNEYIELEWAEMVRGVEEEKKLAKSIGSRDMFKGNINVQ
jgi:hypothetical protein